MTRTCCGKSMPSGSPPTSVTANGTGCRHGGSPGRTGSLRWSPSSPAAPCSATCMPSLTGRWSPAGLTPSAWTGRSSPRCHPATPRSSGPAARSATRPPAHWPTRGTCAAWRRSTIRTTAASGTSGRLSSAPAAGAARSLSCAWTAPAATTACRCSGTTRPRSAATTTPSASPSPSTASSTRAGPRPWPASSTATARQPAAAESSGDGPVPHQRAEPAGMTVPSHTATSATHSGTGPTAWTWAQRSRTRPGTRWPRTCCAPARPSPTSADTSDMSATGWRSITSRSRTPTWKTSSTPSGSPGPARTARAGCCPAAAWPR